MSLQFNFKMFLCAFISFSVLTTKLIPSSFFTIKSSYHLKTCTMKLVLKLELVHKFFLFDKKIIMKIIF